MKHLIIKRFSHPLMKRTDIPYSIINLNNNNNNFTTINNNFTTSANNSSGTFHHCHHLQKEDYLGFLFTSFGEIPGLCFMRYTSSKGDLGKTTAKRWRLHCLYKDMQVITLHSFAVAQLHKLPSLDPRLSWSVFYTFNNVHQRLKRWPGHMLAQRKLQNFLNTLL